MSSAGTTPPDLAAAAPPGVATTREAADALDHVDPLRHLRDRFVVDDELIYLDGNSLGRPPRSALTRISDFAAGQWAGRLVRGWHEGWLELPRRIGDELGDAALGAGAGQVLVSESTSVCLYKLASAALDARPDRTQIVTDRANFPTDRYVLEGLAAARGLEIVWLDGEPAGGPEPAQVAELVGPRTALVSFSHVSYYSSHLADMSAINEIAHAAGALTLWDLSHSVGVVPVALDADNTDLAVGCTYKYLNGGPGSPSFMYVRREHQSRFQQPIWGWLGRRDPFLMEQGFEAAPGIQSFQSGTPPVIALTVVKEGVDLLAEAGIEHIRAKGTALTELAIALADATLAPLEMTVCSPRDSRRRGSHVALATEDAEAIVNELVDHHVLADFRRPNVVRLGLSPLTTRFVDVWDGIAALERVMEKRRTPRRREG